MLLPGINVIARFVATRLGSSALTGTWAAQQQREADEIALRLMERAGLQASLVALELDIGIVRTRMFGGDWGVRYFDSARYVAAIAEMRSRYAVIGY